MYPFPQSVNPAVHLHIDAQTAFFNDLSQTISHSMQQLIQMNMRLGHTLLEETASTARHMLATGRPADALSAAAARAQPATDKLRSYQQELSQLAATTQVALTRVTEQHVQETSRTARALADEVTRVSVEETGKSLRQQEETVRSSREAFRQQAEQGVGSGAPFPGNLQSGAGDAGAKHDGPARLSPGAGNTDGGNKEGGSREGGNKVPAPAR